MLSGEMPPQQQRVKQKQAAKISRAPPDPANGDRRENRDQHKKPRLTVTPIPIGNGDHQRQPPMRSRQEIGHPEMNVWLTIRDSHRSAKRRAPNRYCRRTEGRTAATQSSRDEMLPPSPFPEDCRSGLSDASKSETRRSTLIVPSNLPRFPGRIGDLHPWGLLPEFAETAPATAHTDNESCRTVRPSKR